MCCFNGLILPEDPDVSLGLLCLSAHQSVKVWGFFTVTSNDSQFLQTLDENGVPAVSRPCYCLRLLADICLLSDVSLIYWARSLQIPCGVGFFFRKSDHDVSNSCAIFLTTSFVFASKKKRRFFWWDPFPINGVQKCLILLAILPSGQSHLKT